MTAYLVFADALTALGAGRDLWAALKAGQSGLSATNEVFPNWFPDKSSRIGVFKELGESSNRAARILDMARERILPAEVSKCDFIVGACSLGDLTGPCKGEPHEQLQQGFQQMFPHLTAEKTMLVSSACSSGTDGFATAAMLVESGLEDVVGVFAFDTLEPGKLLQHFALGTQSVDGAKPFDSGRDGTSFGEGAAFAIIANERGLTRFQQPPLAVVAGYGMSCDAMDITAPDTSGEQPAQAIARALAHDESLLSRVGYINAHGSGTHLNDSTEALALRQVFGERLSRIPVSGTKGATGHLAGGTGLAELVFTAWALDEGLAPATAGLTDVDGSLGLCVANHTQAIPAGLDAAMSVTFGFGGVNSAVILERFQV